MDNVIIETMVTDEFMPVRDLYVELPNIGKIKLARVYLEGFRYTEMLGMLPEPLCKFITAISAIKEK